ncbi:hypothetical protein QBC45DRAFT_444384 [Copromyces sp. CBS 386.78]|nr:hypothetical protein QBC45DRAFT_444384 [Copromyces sp. CBS 386.78]
MRPLSFLPLITCTLLHFCVGIALPKTPTTPNLILSLREPVHSEHEASSSAAIHAKPRAIAPALTNRQEDDFVSHEVPTTPDEPRLPATLPVSTSHISRSDSGKEAQNDDELPDGTTYSRTATSTAWPRDDSTSKRDSGITSIEKRDTGGLSIGAIAGLIIGGIVVVALIAMACGMYSRKREEVAKAGNANGERGF